MNEFPFTSSIVKSGAFPHLSGAAVVAAVIAGLAAAFAFAAFVVTGLFDVVAFAAAFAVVLPDPAFEVSVPDETDTPDVVFDPVVFDPAVFDPVFVSAFFFTEVTEIMLLPLDAATVFL